MKISEIEKLKNKNTSERELKKYSLLSFWKGMVEYKGKLTKIIFALCHAKKDIKKQGDEKMEKWFENWSKNFEIKMDRKISNIEKEISTINNRISNIEKNQDIMQNEITAINNKISNIDKNQDIMNSRISNIEKNQDIMNSRISNIENDIILIKNCPTIKKEIKSL